MTVPGRKISTWESVGFPEVEGRSARTNSQLKLCLNVVLSYQMRIDSLLTWLASNH